MIYQYILIELCSQIAAVVNRSLDLHFASTEVTVIAEPGRFFVSSAYTLITRIHAKRHLYRDGNLHDVMYYINDGVYGSFNCNLYDHYTAHPIAFDKVRGEFVSFSPINVL